MTEPKPIDTLLAAYGASHRHRMNEMIHIVCVPAIMFSLLALLWTLHPFAAVAAVLAALMFYLRLSRGLAIGMLVLAAAMLGTLLAMPPAAVLPGALLIFVLAWIGQFVGHHIEGKQPAFFDDLRFLLIGPLFVLCFAYRRWRWAY